MSLRPDWLIDAQGRRNAELRSTGLCFCSGVSGHPRPAEYMWKVWNGNEVPLCGPCCAAWRAMVETGECDAPAKIEEWTP